MRTLNVTRCDVSPGGTLNKTRSWPGYVMVEVMQVAALKGEKKKNFKKNEAL